MESKYNRFYKLVEKFKVGTPLANSLLNIPCYESSYWCSNDKVKRMEMTLTFLAGCLPYPLIRLLRYNKKRIFTPNKSRELEIIYRGRPAMGCYGTLTHLFEISLKHFNP
jgi:hypothetical protein